MDDYALILRLDLTDDAPEGPGWYIYATHTADGKPAVLRRPQRISGRHAVNLAVQMQAGMGTEMGANEMTPSQIVMAGNDKIVQRINAQIEAAEAAARRIGQLRRILQTETGDTNA